MLLAREGHRLSVLALDGMTGNAAGEAVLRRPYALMHSLLAVVEHHQHVIAAHERRCRRRNARPGRAAGAARACVPAPSSAQAALAKEPPRP